MNYDGFVSMVSSVSLFGEEAAHLFNSKQAWHLQCSRWVKKGKLLRLKRGLYSLPSHRRVVRFSNEWLANTMYSPSYLSLEYVLSRYDLLMEKVEVITSVGRLKTAKFVNTLGTFSYRSIKKDLFFGFEEVLDPYKKSVLMATPEKALLDYIYFCNDWESNQRYIEENVRLQQLDSLKPKRFKEFAQKFNSKKIFGAVETLLDLR
jgi:predicted transcriptional regulator of viral defense system